mgnify:CR=1 FL=1
MPGIPQLPKFDVAALVLRDPYRFISRQAKTLKTDVFEARLLLNKTIFMTGEEAARVFTDKNLFTRKSAVPEPLRATLFGKGGIQGLDGESHFHRKELFMSLLSSDTIQELQSSMTEWLKIYSERWENQNEVILYPEFQEILTRTICSWAGVELPENQVQKRSRDLSMLYDSAGSPRDHLIVRAARKRSEIWISQMIEDIRSGERKDLHGTPLALFATFRDNDGKLLSSHSAAVDLLSIMRPTIAVSVFFLFVVHALHLDSDSRRRIRIHEAGFLDDFVNEVRRFYPFFPFVAARVKQDFRWGKLDFKRGRRVLLDLYGINHDERIWERPYEFNPDRFKTAKISPYNFVSQGVGDHQVDHRCPGEFLAIELMRGLTEFFVHHISYDVPAQALQINFNRLPAIPESQLRITNVQFSPPFFRPNIITESGVSKLWE